MFTSPAGPVYRAIVGEKPSGVFDDGSALELRERLAVTGPGAGLHDVRVVVRQAPRPLVAHEDVREVVDRHRFVADELMVLGQHERRAVAVVEANVHRLDAHERPLARVDRLEELGTRVRHAVEVGKREILARHPVGRGTVAALKPLRKGSLEGDHRFGEGRIGRRGTLRGGGRRCEQQGADSELAEGYVGSLLVEWDSRVYTFTRSTNHSRRLPPASPAVRARTGHPVL